MHRLLLRQLGWAFGSADVPAPMAPFVKLVDEAYRHLEEDRALIERSLDTVSHELLDRNSRLRAALADSERAQADLAGTLALLEATIESTTDGLLVVDSQGRMVRMNSRFIELWRIPASIVASRSDSEALAFVLDQLERPDEFLDKVKELYALPEAESQDTLHFKDHRVFERFSKPQRVNGQTVGRVWSFRDVTAPVHLETRLRQSQKMEAIGSLAGGVAHDFNNLLTVISGHIEFLQQNEATTASQQEDLAEIQKAAQRATGLTRQLLAFSRKQLLRPTALDLGTVVRELEPMLHRLIGADIQIDSLLAPDTIVTADRGQLEQVLVNLAVNARDAMPDGGCLAIQTVNFAVSTEREICAGVMLTRGAYVVLSVRDTGVGMDPRIVSRIFDPFFTTKETGKGTGLGLATVYGIVKQSGGFIEVESDLGVGTAFTIFLPAAAAGATPTAEHAVVVLRAHEGAATVLLVEDEEALRRFARRVLEKKGYTVLTAASGVEALTLVQGYAGTIDLVLADVVMPGMGGPELMQQLQRTRFAAPVLFMSGYTDHEMIRRGVIQEDTFLLEKPFTADALATAVHDALGSAALV